MRPVSTTPVAAAAALVLLLAACSDGAEPRSVTTPAPAPLERPLMSLGARDVLPDGRVLVPQAAVVVRGGVPGVFVFDAKTALARFRVVRLGARRGARVEVLAGLKGDERLVLGELASVHDGSPIKTPTHAE